MPSLNPIMVFGFAALFNLIMATFRSQDSTMDNDGFMRTERLAVYFEPLQKMRVRLVTRETGFKAPSTFLLTVQ